MDNMDRAMVSIVLMVWSFRMKIAHQMRFHAPSSSSFNHSATYVAGVRICNFPTAKTYLPGISSQVSGKNRRETIAGCTPFDSSFSHGAFAIQGTGRPQMEDTYIVEINSDGTGLSFFGVFDGHGGNAVAEMLRMELWPVYRKKLQSADMVKATITAYEEVDQIALAQPKGLFGALRERGLGGSRCGATAATAVLQNSKDGQKFLVAANVGDARVVLSRRGQAVQLSVDHKPDVESERKRIEAKNPFPKKPLVVNVGGTWRVGGLLALSRAFGDAYLKSSPGGDGGFGLTAEPDVIVEPLTAEDELIVLGTDGLWERMENQEVIDFCLLNGTREKSANDITKDLVKAAQDKGATDDIAVIVLKLTKELEPNADSK